MPLHDWTKVDAGIFHDFHNVWIAELRNSLNSGLLPSGYYALSEQHAGKYITDILALHAAKSDLPRHEPADSGGLAVADAPPKVRRKLTITPAARSQRKSLAIRHVSGHRLVALVEIVSPANKDRREHVQEFVNKIEDALNNNVNVLLVDLLPHTVYDPNGMHGAVWERLNDEPDSSNSDEPDSSNSDEPFTLASYVAGSPMQAYVEYCKLGNDLPDMPLFLDPDWYVNAPLEATYQTTWNGTPEHWRNVLC